jgi:phage shock protein E
MKRIISLLAGLAFLSLSIFATDVKVVSVEETAKLLKSDPKVVVLDIRTPKEFEAGHIKGATNINIADKDFADRIAKLDKSKTYVIHCAAGSRSARACEQIKGMDFQNMLHMKEGFNAWQKAGQPVEK